MDQLVGVEGEAEGGVSVASSSPQGVWQKDNLVVCHRGDGEQKEKLLRYSYIYQL